MKSAISYLRFSSPSQSSGDSYRRQIENTEKYCKTHNLILDSRLEDLGLSGWSGKNLDDTAALGGLVKLINQGKIPKGTHLICENLDRITRGKILDAVSLFTQILKGGVVIHTTMDSKQYSYESVSSNPMELMVSITYLTRGNNESEVKSKRGIESWQKKFRDIKEGKIVKCVCPSWLKFNNGTYSVTEKNKQTIQLIFALYLSGKGVVEIIKELNTRNIKSFTTSGKWLIKFLHTLLQSKSVIGVNTTVEPNIPNYFPTIISEDTFYKAQSQRQSNAVYRSKYTKKDLNIFSGVMKCSVCGGSMIQHDCVTKKPNGKTYHNFYYLCLNNQTSNCKTGFVPRNKVNDSFRSIFWSRQLKSFIVPKTERKDNSDVIQGKLVELQKQMDRVVNAIVITDNPQLAEKLKELQVNKKTLETELETEKSLNVSTNGIEQDFRTIIEGIHSQMKSPEFQLSLRTFLRKTITTIKTNKGGYTVHFLNGETITIKFDKTTFDRTIEGKTETFGYQDFRLAGLK